MFSLNTLRLLTDNSFVLAQIIYLVDLLDVLKVVGGLRAYFAFSDVVSACVRFHVGIGVGIVHVYQTLLLLLVQINNAVFSRNE